MKSCSAKWHADILPNSSDLGNEERAKVGRKSIAECWVKIQFELQHEVEYQVFLAVIDVPIEMEQIEW